MSANSDGRRQRRCPRTAGFTLIELMIVVVILAILAAIAYPSYTHYITRTNRSAAEACLAEYANYMERYYTTHLRYDHAKGDEKDEKDKNTLPERSCSNQTSDNYEYTLSSVTDSTYELKAKPQGAQADRDSTCGTLTLNQTGKRGVGGDGSVKDCW